MLTALIGVDRQVLWSNMSLPQGWWITSSTNKDFIGTAELPANEAAGKQILLNRQMAPAIGGADVVEAACLRPPYLKGGMTMGQTTNVSNTFIATASSTKNKVGPCDPKMYRTKRGQQLYVRFNRNGNYGMKGLEDKD